MHHFGMFKYVNRNIHNSTQEFHSHLYFNLEDHLFHKAPYIDLEILVTRVWISLTNPLIPVMLIQVSHNLLIKMLRLPFMLKESAEHCLQKHVHH